MEISWGSQLIPFLSSFVDIKDGIFFDRRPAHLSPFVKDATPLARIQKTHRFVTPIYDLIKFFCINVKTVIKLLGLSLKKVLKSWARGNRKIFEMLKKLSNSIFRCSKMKILFKKLDVLKIFY